MGLCNTLTAIHNVMDQKSNYELQLTNITNVLQRLAMQSSDILTRQSAEMQAYLDAHKDEEGYPDEAAIQYVNSDAFNTKFQQQLRQIQVKEQQYNTMKEQTQLRYNSANALQESWEKKIDQDEKFFKYMQ